MPQKRRSKTTARKSNLDPQRKTIVKNSIATKAASTAASSSQFYLKDDGRIRASRSERPYTGSTKRYPKSGIIKDKTRDTGPRIVIAELHPAGNPTNFVTDKYEKWIAELPSAGEVRRFILRSYPVGKPPDGRPQGSKKAVEREDAATIKKMATKGLPITWIPPPPLTHIPHDETEILSPTSWKKKTLRSGRRVGVAGRVSNLIPHILPFFSILEVSSFGTEETVEVSL
jgi:hypothetical protein